MQVLCVPDQAQIIALVSTLAIKIVLFERNDSQVKLFVFKSEWHDSALLRDLRFVAFAEKYTGCTIF